MMVRMRRCCEHTMRLDFRLTQVVDVCLVVLGVVELHDLGRDCWLESIVAVRKLGQGVLVCGGCARGRGGQVGLESAACLR